MSADRTRALLELLYNISRELATVIDLRSVLQRVLFQAMENVGGERASIVVLDDAGRPMDATIVYGRTYHEHTTQQLRETVDRGLAGWVVRNRKAALVPDTSRDERWLRREDDSAEKTGAKSAICVPLLARERLVGVLTVVHSLPNAFGPEHLELMQAIADQAGIAVLNARLYNESQRQARVMTALAEGAVAINASLRLDEVLQRILNQTMQALQVSGVALALIEPATGELVFRAAAGPMAGDLRGRRVRPGEGVAGRVAREGRGVIVPLFGQDRRFLPDEHLAGLQVRALACAPIQFQGRVIGVIEALNPLSGAFDADALLVMTGIGSLAGSTIQNALLFERMQAAQQRYRELFEDSVDPILISDRDGRILEANRRAAQLSGYSSDELRGMRVDQLHEINHERTGPSFEQTATQDCVYESMLRKRDGGSLPIEVHVRRIEFESAASLQWILRDISERKHLDALRDDLTAMVYHDLRSPLANIVSSLDLLSGMLPPEQSEQAQAMLNIATHSAARIQRLLSALLDINRLEAGQPIANQQAADPAVLIREALRDVQLTIENRRQSIQLEIAPRLPAVWVDTDMIRRVLINLLENATKFTPQDGTIEIGARASGEWVELWVRDTGPGIPPADQQRIFEKFTRLRGKDSPGGLGIGLAFCRLAVQGHGGRIWVESQPGQGARFSFTLPVAKT